MKVICQKIIVIYVKLKKDGYFAYEKREICFLEGKWGLYVRLFCVDLISFVLVDDDYPQVIDWKDRQKEDKVDLIWEEVLNESRRSRMLRKMMDIAADTK